MPTVNEREHVPYLTRDGDSDYLVSFRDYADDNEEAVEWFLEHHEQIAQLIASRAQLVYAATLAHNCIAFDQKGTRKRIALETLANAIA
jgi:hypothetical protein